MIRKVLRFFELMREHTQEMVKSAEQAANK